MNLRWMNTKCYMPIKLVLLVALAGFIYGCSDTSGDEVANSGDAITATHDDGDDERRCRGDDCDRTPGDGGTLPAGTLNVVATHNPQSSQYNDNCLDCHGDIPDAQSLNPAIPDAHVAMLAFTPGEQGEQCAWCHRDVSENLILTAAAVGPFQSNIRKLVDTQQCSICHGPVGPGKQFYQTGISAANVDGAQLYQYLCAACHRDLSNSEVGGESAQEVYEAIAEDEGGMAPLRVLNPQWIVAIAGALGGDTTLPSNIPAAGSGESLYWQYCSICHRDLNNSEVSGESLNEIQEAIDDNEGGTMGMFRFLTTEQLQSIVDALNGHMMASNN